jgi:superfamily I DNA/RNA helicase
VVLHAAADERAEAAFVVDRIERLLGGSSFHSLDSGRVEPWQDAWQDRAHSFADVAVLYRTDAQARALADALDAEGIPYQKRSHHRLADQPGVREVLAALRADAATGNGSARPVLARLRAAAVAASGAAAALADVPGDDPDGSDPEPRVEQVRAAVELLTPLAERSGVNLGQFLAEIPLGAEVDLLDPRADRVSLLTLHAAKGLEFPVVFVTGCEDGLLPFRFPGEAGPDADAELAEERRLFFVGLTRARAALVLTWARRRAVRGQIRDSAPSRFLADLDAALLDRTLAPARRSNVQLRLL